MPCNYPPQDSCTNCDCELAEIDTPRAYDFNPDPHWQEYIQRFEPEIHKIALKYMVVDEGLREDTMQEARIALATLRAEKCDQFEPYVRGEITVDQWNSALDRYCRNAIRNSILSYLDSYASGNWYIGRTRSVKDKRTGRSRKVYLPPRFSSYDELTDEYGMQVDTDGNISWPEVSEDGMADHNKLANAHQKKGRWFLPNEAPAEEVPNDNSSTPG